MKSNGYAVRFRYPGEIATRAEAKEAVQASRKVSGVVRGLLGLT